MTTCAPTSRARPRRCDFCILGIGSHNYVQTFLFSRRGDGVGPSAPTKRRELCSPALPGAGRPRLDAGPMPLEVWSYCAHPLGASAPQTRGPAIIYQRMLAACTEQVRHTSIKISAGGPSAQRTA